MSAELVVVQVRLVGNVTGKVYALSEVEVESELKTPMLYLGSCHLAIPFKPVQEIAPWPELDPEDTEVELQMRTNSAHTRLGRSSESPFPYIGLWRGFLLELPRADVEIPNGVVS